MPSLIRMPEVVANATEATLVSWFKSSGDEVAIGDELAEIETEKALVSVVAEEAGTLGRQLVEAGQSVDVGAAIAVLATGQDTDADIDALLGETDQKQEQSATSPTEIEALPASRDPESGSPVLGDLHEIPAVKESTPSAVPSSIVTVPSGAAARLFVSPIARRRAKDLGVNPATLIGTGPGGRIVRADVELAATVTVTRGKSPIEVEEKVAVTPTAFAPASVSRSTTPFTEIPNTGMRRSIARRLTESKSQVPHFYLTTDCNVDALFDLRKSINATSLKKISVNDFVVKAVALALMDVPAANVSWTESSLLSFSQADISVAVATQGGLLTPIIRRANERSISSISGEILELSERARAGRLRQDEIDGGTFSVTNLGMYGTMEFSAILNPPQAGILAVGAARKQPVVINGELAIATVMKCTLSADHRAIDGAVAAEWLAAFTARIENPLSILV